MFIASIPSSGSRLPAVRHSLSRWMVMFCMGGVVGSAVAQQLPLAGSGSASSSSLIHFDMPSQSLKSALTQYHSLTRQSLLYDDSIAEGRVVAPLQGDFTPEGALLSLLAGTGIVAAYTSRSAFVLERPVSSAAASVAQPGIPAYVAPGKRAYYAQLQEQVTVALCSDSATAPGAYRLAANFWVDQGRKIARLQFHTTGDLVRDARVRAVLSGLTLKAAPPAGASQPFTMLILPRADCATVGEVRVLNGQAGLA